jgi:hypothetical protein
MTFIVNRRAATTKTTLRMKYSMLEMRPNS